MIEGVISELRARRKAHRAKSVTQPGWSKQWAANRAKSAAQMDSIAERVSQGWTIKAAGAEIGVGDKRALVIWRKIKDQLGGQAA